MRSDGQCKPRDRNPKKGPKEILEIKNTATEMKNAFVGHSRQDMAEERLIGREYSNRILKKRKANSTKIEKQK